MYHVPRTHHAPRTTHHAPRTPLQQLVHNPNISFDRGLRRCPDLGPDNCNCSRRGFAGLVFATSPISPITDPGFNLQACKSTTQGHRRLYVPFYSIVPCTYTTSTSLSCPLAPRVQRQALSCGFEIWVLGRGGIKVELHSTTRVLPLCGCGNGTGTAIDPNEDRVYYSPDPCQEGLVPGRRATKHLGYGMPLPAWGASQNTKVGDVCPQPRNLPVPEPSHQRRQPPQRQPLK